MTLFVDTSVWSLALRRDVPVKSPQVEALKQALGNGGQIVATGIVLQELLQGFSGPKAVASIIERFSAIPFVIPDRADHISAAELRNTCRRNGVQVGTIDALLAQLCIRHDLTMLSTDKDFSNIEKLASLKMWKPV
jgi:predicted nucleic acid-binding protein